MVYLLTIQPMIALALSWGLPNPVLLLYDSHNRESFCYQQPTIFFGFILIHFMLDQLHIQLCVSLHCCYFYCLFLLVSIGTLFFFLSIRCSLSALSCTQTQCIFFDLFCSVLFCFVLFCFVLPCFNLFSCCCTLFYFIFLSSRFIVLDSSQKRL